jgi:hypothetical protein
METIRHVRKRFTQLAGILENAEARQLSAARSRRASLLGRRGSAAMTGDKVVKLSTRKPNPVQDAEAHRLIRAMLSRRGKITKYEFAALWRTTI